MDKGTNQKINKEIIEKVLQFGKMLEKDGIPIYKLIIFGSYAKNKATASSDIDVCIVSSRFGKDSIDELQFLFKERRKIDSRIEPYPASPKEYAEIDTPLISEIRKYGFELSLV